MNVATAPLVTLACGVPSGFLSDTEPLGPADTFRLMRCVAVPENVSDPVPRPGVVMSTGAAVPLVGMVPDTSAGTVWRVSVTVPVFAPV